MKNLKALVMLAFLAVTAPVIAQTTQDKAQTELKTKKDGTPDKRYAENKKLKKDGTPDKRYNENKNLKKDGTPDKRFKTSKSADSLKAGKKN
ncbi:hypothetical protein DYBT9623_00627 [Dyadobacter sp. CECT 9623]|uniref:Uncharacterized protein n=1 Tax=Dyadobacter linearis TaxID=2823330 RepID=A0ABM8UKA3_9BACT|nr:MULTISPECIES: hypothetical protein [unclassified Dyadobacter]MCE7063252.1 hypothetical protein [Dyadobacter sp. CY343]CAG5067900.1 hypothetical protein DYBT9623_00627 [Dyadobacter sp. CECT 9623]